MRQKDREKEKKGRKRRKRKKRRKKGRKRHSLLFEGWKQLSKWETGESRLTAPGDRAPLREQAQELVRVTFRLACWLPDCLCQSVENHTAQPLFHQPFGFLGASPMSPDALQGQMTCQRTSVVLRNTTRKGKGGAVFVDSWAVSYVPGT